MTQKQQIENHRKLSEKRIVVLGGSSGIGLAVAQQAVARGAKSDAYLKFVPRRFVKFGHVTLSVKLFLS
ncbi:MAG TPA: hypothetical protein VF749_12555 [Candidatus Acidoferrum sp.]